MTLDSKTKKRLLSLKMQTKNLQRQIKSLEESNEDLRADLKAIAKGDFYPFLASAEAQSETFFRLISDLKNNPEMAVFEAASKLEEVLINLSLHQFEKKIDTRFLSEDDFIIIIEALEHYAHIHSNNLELKDKQAGRNKNNYLVHHRKTARLLEFIKDSKKVAE
jgi:hypothetical protein